MIENPIHNSATDTDYDIIIVGGGMVGASMAIAAAQSGFRSAVIEAFAVNDASQPSFDERTIALTYSSYRIYKNLGLWQAIAPKACAIESIEVTNENHWGFTHLDKNDVGTKALGYVVATRDMGNILHDNMQANPLITLISPAEAINCQSDADKTVIEFRLKDSLKEAGSCESQFISAKCAVVADGGRSPLLATLNINNDTKAYQQQALLAIVRSNTAHNHNAFEHFMSDGPLALLPYRDNDYAMVWTANKADISALEALDDAAFLAKLSATFTKRAGPFTDIGKRSTYPLSIGALSKAVDKRLCIIGNAAHIVHPVAGQGFNLGLRDVAALIDIFNQYPNDPGQDAALASYNKMRSSETARVSRFTDGLIKAFSSKKLPVVAARNIGLSLINLMPATKKQLLQRTMGIHKPASKLLRRLK